MLAQANRATRNNVFGLLLPQNVIPSISGPVLGTNNFGTAWGSAVGILVTWEPLILALRRAECGCCHGGANTVRGHPEADSIRCLGSGRGRVRNFGRRAGDCRARRKLAWTVLRCSPELLVRS